MGWRVLDSSIIQGPFSAVPCQTLVSRFATFASLNGGSSQVLRLAASLRAKLPKPLRREDAGRRTFSEAAGALGTVLGQEMDRFNRLLAVMERR
jgi:hypothetical protein